MDFQDYGGHSPSIHCHSRVAVTVGFTPELTPVVILTLTTDCLVLLCLRVAFRWRLPNQDSGWFVGTRPREEQDVGKMEPELRMESYRRERFALLSVEI